MLGPVNIAPYGKAVLSEVHTGMIYMWRLWDIFSDDNHSYYQYGYLWFS